MPRPTKPCVQCGTPFERNPKYGKAQWEQASYCSNACRSASIRLDRPLCKCGCGERVAKPRSEFRPGHNPWGGNRKTVKFDGRRWYIHDRQGRKVYWSRIVLANKIGRELTEVEIAHHINGDRTDDRPENLELKASQSVHMKEHYENGELHPVDWRDRWRK